jgi:hypothetical protein
MNRPVIGRIEHPLQGDKGLLCTSRVMTYAMCSCRKGLQVGQELGRHGFDASQSRETASQRRCANEWPE